MILATCQCCSQCGSPLRNDCYGSRCEDCYAEAQIKCTVPNVTMAEASKNHSCMRRRMKPINTYDITDLYESVREANY